MSNLAVKRLFGKHCKYLQLFVSQKSQSIKMRKMSKLAVILVSYLVSILNLKP